MPGLAGPMTRFPRPSPPQVTVPRSYPGLSKATFYVPAHDPALVNAVEWSIDPPFKVAPYFPLQPPPPPLHKHCAPGRLGPLACRRRRILLRGRGRAFLFSQ